MALTKKSDSIYAKCDPITRTKPDYEVDEQLYNELVTGYRILPNFENTLFDKVYTRHYSLRRNEFLKCRWLQYTKNIELRVFAPLKFSDVKDLHFYNGAVQLRPDVSIRNMEHRKKMAPGPGVDSLGHLPIPQEAMMKRGTADIHSIGQKVKKTHVKPD